MLLFFSNWYTDKDYKATRKENKRVVQELHQIHVSLSSISSQAESADNEEVFGGCVMTGIENLLTPRIIKKSHACMTKRRNAVLSEQEHERQNQVGERDPYKLACMSHLHSSRSIKRAHKIGLVQSLIVRCIRSKVDEWRR